MLPGFFRQGMAPHPLEQFATMADHQARMMNPDPTNDFLYQMPMGMQGMGTMGAPRQGDDQAIEWVFVLSRKPLREGGIGGVGVGKVPPSPPRRPALSSTSLFFFKVIHSR